MSSIIQPAAFEGSAGGEEEDSMDLLSPPPPTLTSEYTEVSPTKSPPHLALSGCLPPHMFLQPGTLPSQTLPDFYLM